jgi:hypothetical protein
MRTSGAACRRFFASALAAAMLSLVVNSATVAGPVAEFETALRVAYADYRAALFHSNAKNAEGTAKAIATFEAKWSALSIKYASPPPQYVDDPKWDETLAKVKFVIDHAEVVVDKGELPEAHEMLEEIRDIIGGLHARNGIVGFSDRMNAFHTAMEHMLQEKFDASGFGTLREQAAVLAYLAGELDKFPPPEVAEPDYAPMLKALQQAVADMQAAARTNDVAGARAALTKIKPAYAKLFLKFG